mmetsp:Transcript_4253/g.9212  ORF Transcript_4253/g.9212 Transcript_4253/m.9212 type:complete len:612 (+) Transcript_4253:265-2100(+)
MVVAHRRNSHVNNPFGNTGARLTVGYADHRYSNLHTQRGRKVFQRPYLWISLAGIFIYFFSSSTPTEYDPRFSTLMDSANTKETTDNQSNNVDVNVDIQPEAIPAPLETTERTNSDNDSDSSANANLNLDSADNNEAAENMGVGDESEEDKPIYQGGNSRDDEEENAATYDEPINQEGGDSKDVDKYEGETTADSDSDPGGVQAAENLVTSTSDEDEDKKEYEPLYQGSGDSKDDDNEEADANPDSDSGGVQNAESKVSSKSNEDEDEIENHEPLNKAVYKGSGDSKDGEEADMNSDSNGVQTADNMGESDENEEAKDNKVKSEDEGADGVDGSTDNKKSMDVEVETEPIDGTYDQTIGRDGLLSAADDDIIAKGKSNRADKSINKKTANNTINGTLSSDETESKEKPEKPTTSNDVNTIASTLSAKDTNAAMYTTNTTSNRTKASIIVIPDSKENVAESKNATSDDSSFKFKNATTSDSLIQSKNAARTSEATSDDDVVKSKNVMKTTKTSSGEESVKLNTDAEEVITTNHPDNADTSSPKTGNIREKKKVKDEEIESSGNTNSPEIDSSGKKEKKKKLQKSESTNVASGSGGDANKSTETGKLRGSITA